MILTASKSLLSLCFLLQNVLKQMGLPVLSVDGVLIRQTRTWILRCYACYKLTSLMDKKFCPRCGHKTLKRVACTVNKDGTMEVRMVQGNLLTY